MKRSLSVLFSLALLILSLGICIVPATALTTGDGFHFSVDGGYAVITKYDGDATVLTVPDMLGGKPVQTVAANVFEGNTALTQVHLPASVTTIGECAFYGCSSLTDVTVGYVQSIGFGAFEGCTALRSVTYCGNSRSWQAVDVARGNDVLETAAFTFLDMENGISLLPADAGEFLTLSEGGGVISIEEQADGYRFSGTGGWPSAYTRRSADQYAKVNVFSDTYLNFDFTVSGGMTNIILAFNGMDVVDMRTVGHYVTLNRLIDPSYVDENGIIYDLNTGTYTASVHVGALGCDPSLVTNGMFEISDIKIYSVNGATVTVRDLSLGEAKYDVIPLPQTSYRIAASQSLLPSTPNGFIKHNIGTSTVTVSAAEQGYAFRSDHSWPSVSTHRFETGEPFAWASLDDYIYYDFTVYASAATHIVTYFGGAPTSTESYGSYTSLNPYIHPNYSSGGVIIDLPRGVHRGFIRVGDLNPDLTKMQNGKVAVSDILIYVVNGAVDVRELAVAEIETYDTPDEPTTTTTTATTTTATTTYPPTEPHVTFTVTASKQEVTVGDVVDVSVDVSEDHRLVNGQLWLDYDPSVLEPVAVSEDDYINGLHPAVFDSSYFYAFNVPTPGRAKLAFASDKLNGPTVGGTVFTLTFRVIAEVGDGTDITLSSPEMCGAINGTDYDLAPAFVNTALTAAPQDILKGDINGDGAVDIKDAMAAFYHVNEYRYLDEDGEARANVNGDGGVDIKDAMRIFYYVNEYIDEI